MNRLTVQEQEWNKIYADFMANGRCEYVTLPNGDVMHVPVNAYQPVLAS